MLKINKYLIKLASSCFLFLTFLLNSADDSFAESSQQNTIENRPKIGLVLGGGGARGFAHIGVLKVLEDHNIPIDYIAGTSMGSIIAGLYASGMTPAEIETAVANIDWDTIFSDNQNRQDRSVRRKSDDHLFLMDLKAGVNDDGVNVSTALFQGQKFDLVLTELTLPASGITNFDQLSIPYRAVATDIATGKEVVLSNGNLGTAMRASMSVPAIFAGVHIDDKLLVDGGVSNNLPVSVVKEMGADIVIAVSVGTPLRKKEDLKSALSVIEQLSGLLTNNNTERQIALLGEQDILITPPLGDDITAASFHSFPEAISLGREEAEKHSSRLSVLSISNTQYQDYLASKNTTFFEPPIIHQIVFDNNSKLSDEFLLKQLKLKTGEKLDLKQLKSGIANIYGLGTFESVRYELKAVDDQQDIIIIAEEKSWGTDNLRFGMDLAVDGRSGSSKFNISSAYTKIPLNELNGEWRSFIQIGEEPALTTEIYQPLTTANSYFVFGKAGYETTNIRLFQNENAIAEYDISQLIIDVAAGRNFGTWGELRAGYRRYTGDVDLLTGFKLLDGYQFDGGETYLRLTTDELDNVFFPRSGYFGQIEGMVSRESLGAEDDFEQITTALIAARSWGNDTLMTRIKFNTTVGNDAPLQNLYTLGGFMNLSGLQENQIIGQHSGLITANYQRRLYKSSFVPVYLGASLEVGNTWDKSSDLLEDHIFASSVFLGTDTPIGPFYMAYGLAEGGQSSFYLFLGNPWF
ncbi:MAG: patatin [Gammaproteobacteria bacterium]|nr:MAG: patatin [Gammaproteobacteria bacterium]